VRAVLLTLAEIADILVSHLDDPCLDPPEPSATAAAPTVREARAPRQRKKRARA
jgi:hypothetical protein